MNAEWKPGKVGQWQRAVMPNCYVSVDGAYTAELRAAGFDAGFGCKLTRHYAIRHRGNTQIIGTARTLAEATRRYL